MAKDETQKEAATSQPKALSEEYIAMEKLFETDKEQNPVKYEAKKEERSEERRVGKECRARWSPYQ